jgi:NTE family protein
LSGPTPPSETAAFLGRVPPFTDFPAELLETVAGRTRAVRLQAGEWLFRQGDEGGSLFVVRSGRLELVREEDGHDTAVGLLGPGDALGELSLLLQEPRTLSVRAIRDSDVLCLERADAVTLLRNSAPFSAGLARVIARYLQDRALARGLADAQGSVLTFLALDPRASIARLREAMAAIPAKRQVAVLDGTGIVHADFAAVLDRAEQENDRVFLLAGGPDAPAGWDDFCLRQADRLIALVPPGVDAPRLGARPELTGCDLVFWAKPGRMPGVPAWLDRLAPRSHHFVDPDDLVPTVARTLRRLAGLSVGAVLSGGGALALAHIGVLAELAEAGVLVDRIGGSSFGALVGGLFALGLSADEVVGHCRRELVANWPFNDYTVPRVAMLRGRKLRAALERMFGDARIEQAPLDYFAVSADLLTSELAVHRRGRFTDALRASLALPGMLPPVVDDGRLLIDGSALSGLPVQEMAAFEEGPVIAVDVIGAPLKVRRRRRLNGMPRITETISRSTLIGGAVDAAAARGLARLVVQPDVGGVGQFEFSRIDELVAAGRQAARNALAGSDDLLTTVVPIS